MNTICISLVVLVLAIIVILSCRGKENFVQGYDHLIAGCIKKCESDILRRDPFFVQLQEGGRFAQNFCQQACATKFNRGNCDGCRLRVPSYTDVPLKKCRYPTRVGHCNF